MEKFLVRLQIDSTTVGESFHVTGRHQAPKRLEIRQGIDGEKTDTKALNLEFSHEAIW